MRFFKNLALVTFFGGTFSLCFIPLPPGATTPGNTSSYSDSRKYVKDLCESGGGKLTKFSDSCLDLCFFKRDPTASCEALGEKKESCDCGPAHCWTHTSCEGNDYKRPANYDDD